MDDWEYLGENVLGHTVAGWYKHEDRRFCCFHQRLNRWTFDGNKGCLRDHDENDNELNRDM